MVKGVNLKSIFLLLSLVILSTSVCASDFVSLIESVKTDIYYDEKAILEVYTTNLQDTEDIVKLNLKSLNWQFQSDPLNHYFSGIKIKPGETIKTKLIISTTNAIGIGRYIVGIDFSSRNTNKKITKNVAINVKPYGETGMLYKTSVDVTATFDEEIDPRNPFSIKINLDNRNPLNITNLSMNIQSELFNEYRETTLNPLVEKSEVFSFILDPLQEPINGHLSISVKNNDNVLRIIEKDYSITEYSNLEKSYDEKEFFFKNTKTLTIVNNGNIENTEVIKIPKGIGIFEKTSPKATISKEITGKYYSWQLSLAPEESTKIIVVTNYRIIFILIIIIIIIASIYFILRPDIIINKVGTVVAKREGGSSEIKILLHIKNRSNTMLQGLNVIDRVPTLVDVSSEQTMGTLAPTKILKHEKKGTLLKWNIETLEPQEERILSYKIVTKLSILGQFSLPTTVVKYTNQKGKEKLASSNKSKV